MTVLPEVSEKRKTNARLPSAEGNQRCSHIGILTWKTYQILFRGRGLIIRKKPRGGVNRLYSRRWVLEPRVLCAVIGGWNVQCVA